MSPLTARTRLRFWITGEDIERWASVTYIFFILAIGRSGTFFLANLLNQAPGACVFHEPQRGDRLAYQQAFLSEQQAIKYRQSFRKKDMYLRMRRSNANAYAEFNSLLRRHCIALKSEFPNAIILHLVRDGRDVSRSMMSRKTMTPEDRHTVPIYPREGDPWREKRDEMDRFRRLCWYWQVEGSFLRCSIGRTIQFEKLVSSYSYFKEELLDACGISVPRETWQHASRIPSNVTQRYRIPHWSEWDTTRTETFRAICGEEMRANGYVL